MRSHINRRKFLKTAAVGTAGIVILKNSASARTYQANNKLRLAIVGCAGRGEWFVSTLPKIEIGVALCDVDERKCQGSYRRQPDVPKFRDYRKMFDKMEKQIDAVIVATPDNTHAVISIAAMKRGKAVYCEKPLSRDVWESRVMRDVARKHKVATQMGNQGTASPGFRRGMELIQSGTIGEVRQVYVYKDSAGNGNRPLPKGKMDIPKTLD
ncbi:MAG: Gfo/Idh/MocA family oxidoreductase [Phycisphaerae bacterium]|nr:Gfo/Idh/MocA family oxidoreductase [Phycisphaerae bacterium]